jgi:hypothetical protein
VSETQKRPRPRKGYAMLKLTTDDAEGQAPEITQTLDELAREGARRMIAAALEAEVAQLSWPNILIRSRNVTHPLVLW